MRGKQKKKGNRPPKTFIAFPLLFSHQDTSNNNDALATTTEVMQAVSAYCKCVHCFWHKKHGFSQYGRQRRDQCSEMEVKHKFFVSQTHLSERFHGNNKTEHDDDHDDQLVCR